jgi:hypothetical protein
LLSELGKDSPCWCNKNFQEMNEEEVEKHNKAKKERENQV